MAVILVFSTVVYQLSNWFEREKEFQVNFQVFIGLMFRDHMQYQTSLFYSGVNHIHRAHKHMKLLLLKYANISRFNDYFNV